MLTAYCPNCQKKHEYVIRENLIENFKGYPLKVKEEIPICSNCNKEIFIPEVEEQNLIKLYGEYRKVANIVSPADLIDFRNRFNISQRELVAILNWGKMTVNRYEKGAIPSSSHNDLLKIIMKDEMIFKEKVEDAFKKGRITKKSYNKIKQKFNHSIKDMMKKLCIQSLTHTESEYNGYRKFDIDRVTNLIGYIADKVELYKTNLNKFLWYIDFENFKRQIRSITGIQYMRYTHGPVIEEFGYNEILNFFNDKFKVIETERGNNTITKIESNKNYDLSIFDDDEIKVINDVIAKFKDMSCIAISQRSHKEDAWKENSDKDLISYNYAMDLKENFSD
ncbi:type II TA system antitoxin MqsA family protein [Proteinivorax tanatarense]|uniref:Type II TA system antitoxin MqsA family protein n=1 Tax=Proteinivorax tanatarense TaxID=1260629 RepID=A0AAU7VMH2_9FIRM